MDNDKNSSSGRDSGFLETSLDNKKNQREEQKKVMKIILYIQMELCKETLEKHLNDLNIKYPDLCDQNGYLKRLKIADQIVQALHVIHIKHKLIHRDLSLKNIFIGKDRLVKIGDFGLATKCQIIEPLMPSPFCFKPQKCEDIPEAFSLDGNDTLEEDSELTHGLGTNTFASPEQMSDRQYNQKVLLTYVIVIDRHLLFGFNLVGNLLSNYHSF